MGIWSGKAEAASLKKEIQEFLQSLKLELSEEKTLITNAGERSARFLGVLLKRRSNKGGRYTVKRGSGKMNLTKPKITLTTPISDLIERLDSKGFLSKGGHLKGRSVSKLLCLPIKDMIL